MHASLPLSRAPAAAAGRPSRRAIMTIALAQPPSKARASVPRPSAQAQPVSPTALRGPAHALAESAAAAAAALLDDEPPVEELKLMLLDSLYGTERGLTASSEVRLSF